MQHLQGHRGTSPKTFGTTSLIRHLKQHHLVEFAKFDKGSKDQHFSTSAGLYELGLQLMIILVVD